jgi:Tfp pilus assembly protein PilO
MMKIRSNPWLQKQQLGVLLIGVLFVADFVLCGYWPSRRQLATLREKRGSYEQAIQMARLKGAQLQTFRKRLTETGATAVHYGASVPSESSLGVFLSQVSELMTRQRMTNPVVVPGKETQAGDLVCIPVRITGTGSLTEIFEFFKGLQALSRLVRIDDTTLKNDNGYAGTVTMEADVAIYYRPGPAPVQTEGGTRHGA